MCETQSFTPPRTPLLYTAVFRVKNAERLAGGDFEKPCFTLLKSWVVEQDPAILFKALKAPITLSSDTSHDYIVFTLISQDDEPIDLYPGDLLLARNDGGVDVVKASREPLVEFLMSDKGKELACLL